MPYVLRRDMLRVRDSNGEYIELDTMKGDTGATGAKGETGETGATPHFTVGTVSTGEPGTPASVSITGTDENPVLNMSIPKGDTGETGQKGETGETGATPHFTIGTVTTGLPGTDASAEITGTDEEPVLNMTIPRGNPGEVTEEELSVVEEGLSHKADSIRDETTGDIVSINSELTATLEEASFEFHPVQDLHGQEYPYPGGGGKNKFPFVVGGTSNGVTATVGEDGSVTFNGTASSNAIFYTDDFEVKAGTYIITCGKDLSDSSVACYLKNISGSASEGATLTFSEDKTIKGVVQVYSGQTVTNKTIYPMLRLTSETDSTYVPYSNICPISGYDSLNAYRTGKNLLAKPFAYRPVPSRLSDCFFIKAGTYTFSFDTIGSATSWRFGIAMFDSDGNALSANEYRPNPNTNFVDSVKIWWLGSNASVKTFSLTYLVDCYTRIWFGSGDTTDQMIATGAQLELDSTASTYEQYNGQSVTYQLGQTVYDGVLTINEYGSGQIVSKYKREVFDGSADEDIATYPTYDGFRTPFNPERKSGMRIDGWCNQLKNKGTDHVTPSIWFGVNNTGMYFTNLYSIVGVDADDTDSEKVAKFRAYLSNAPLEVVWELAEPIIIPLSQQETLSLIEGQNYIWHDANGNTTIIYRVDTKQYIDAVKEELDSAEADLDTLEEYVSDMPEDGTTANALQLLSENYTEDSELYVFRKSVSGDREFDEIVGGTIAWNQQVKYPKFSTMPTATAGSATASDGVLTFTATGGSSAYITLQLQNKIVNHVYLLLVDEKLDNNNTETYPHTVMCVSWSDSSGYRYLSNPSKGKWATLGSIFKPSAMGNLSIYPFSSGSSGVVANSVAYIKAPLAIDLTQMFGSAIADYLYNLETATAGAGVALFKSMFPKPYYDYNVGELKSITGLVSHDTVGFNQWDEEWENGRYSIYTGEAITSGNGLRNKNKIKVMPNAEYHIEFSNYYGSTGVLLLYYDADENYISYENKYAPAYNANFTTPSNAYYICFNLQTSSVVTTYKNDICINISCDKDGIYEPYVKRSYPLDSSLTLRGIPKLANNKMYFDGDTYESDGAVTRRYGVVDLGTLNWARTTNQSLDISFFYVTLADAKGAGIGEYANIFCPNYKTASYNGTVAIINTDKTVCVANTTHYCYIRDDSYSDAATFKTAMSGVYLVYELATPTTETAEPFQSPQICSEYGTEEYVYDSEAFPVPVGHVTKYPDNLRKKLDGLPWDLSMIAPIETGTKASQAYAVGKYFLLDGKFCKAKTSIASGATFTLNTNYEVTTVADELFTAINS